MMDLDCSLLRIPFVEQTMTALGYFGRGGIARAVALSLAGYGSWYGREGLIGSTYSPSLEEIPGNPRYSRSTYLAFSLARYRVEDHG